MQLRDFLLTLVFLACSSAHAFGDEAISPADAAKEQGKHKIVTVEFVVGSWTPYPPLGDQDAFFRVFPTPSLGHKDAFAVDVNEKVLAKLGIKDVKELVGKKIRVTGRVETIIFSGFRPACPGMFVDDPKEITLNVISPLVWWEGEVDKPALLRSLPENGVITDREALRSLWSTWSIRGNAPEVNYESNFILVATDFGGSLGFSVNCDNAGNITVSAAAATKFAGFSYVAMVLPRTGVKTVNGKEIAKGLRPVPKPPIGPGTSNDPGSQRFHGNLPQAIPATREKQWRF